MAWTQKYNALFVRPLIDQVIAIIQRDQASAIAAVAAPNGSGSSSPPLQPITEFHKGPVVPVAPLWMYLSAGGIRFDRESWDTRHYLATLQLALYVGQVDPDQGQQLIFDYGRMLDMVLTSAGPPPGFGDWTSPLPIAWPPGASPATTTPPAAGSVKDVFVESHEYQPVRLGESEMPLWRVVLNVLFEMEEV
jgi:hypothetical protein